MSIDRLRAHYGFSRMPFGKDLAPGMLHAHGAHAEAVARIGWCISEQAIGVVSGECGAGKTRAAVRAASGRTRAQDGEHRSAVTYPSRARIAETTTHATTITTE